VHSPPHVYVQSVNASSSAKCLFIITPCRLLQKITETRANLKLQAPDIVLNVEVIKAEGLRAKDCNGLSDPFCTLYLSNVPTQRYNTSVKSKTLAPSWEEHFSL
jgi:Ca2+-dependent lipid-binding protein